MDSSSENSSSNVSGSTSDSKPCSPSWLLFVVGLVGVIIGIILMLFYNKSELNWFNTGFGNDDDGVESFCLMPGCGKN